MSIVSDHFDLIAKDYDFYKKKNWFYYQNLKKLLSNLIFPNKNVLEIGCGTGDLLAYLKPKNGYGMDISPKMIKLAKQKYPRLTYSTEMPKSKNWDYIFMCDVIEHLENPMKTFAEIAKQMNKKTIFICTMANPIWEPILILAEKFKLKMPEGKHYRYTSEETKKLLESVDLRIVKHDFKLFFPKYIPIITKIVNCYLEPTFKKYAFIEYFVAQKI